MFILGDANLCSSVLLADDLDPSAWSELLGLKNSTASSKSVLLLLECISSASPNCSLVRSGIFGIVGRASGSNLSRASS